MTNDFTRRGVLKTGAVAGAGLAVPTIFTAGSAAAYTNAPLCTPARSCVYTGQYPTTNGASATTTP